MIGPLLNPSENKEVTTKKALKLWGKGPFQLTSDLALDCYILLDGAKQYNNIYIERLITQL